MALKLVVEGWRRIPHSYAIVNQWQLLSLLKRRDIELFIVDRPLYQAGWVNAPDPFDERQKKLLGSIRAKDPLAIPDCTYRIDFPYDFSRPRTKQLLVFATAEYRAI